jgi:ribosome biogenesis GTPase A
MDKKCCGCGAVIQDKDRNKEGFVRPDNYKNSKLCERCFRIRNYGEYTKITKTNQDFIPILDEVNKTKDLVLLVVDSFMIQNDFNMMKRHLKDNPIILVLTKRDILPKSMNNKKLIDYIKKFNLDVVDSVIISGKKNYNLDLLMDKIYKYKKSNNVYVIGYTNAGKSTMINKIIYNYSKIDNEVTTSILPSTTLSSVDIKVDDELTLIDTPGILDENSIVDVVDIMTLKRLTPKKEIKPISIQVKVPQIIIIDNLVRLDLSDNNIIIYMSDGLRLDRFYKDNDRLKELVKRKVRISKNQDLVINGLGFIKFMKDDTFVVYVPKGVDVYTRDALI